MIEIQSGLGFRVREGFRATVISEWHEKRKLAPGRKRHGSKTKTIFCSFVLATGIHRSSRCLMDNGGELFGFGMRQWQKFSSDQINKAEGKLKIMDIRVIDGSKSFATF